MKDRCEVCNQVKQCVKTIFDESICQDCLKPKLKDGSIKELDKSLDA